MQLSKLRKYRRRHRFWRDLILDNPALLLGVDLPFVVACAFSLKNAAALSIQMLMIHLVTLLVGRLFTIRLPLRWRAMANVCVSTVMMLLSREIVMRLFPGIVNSVGMYLYLMAVNGLTLIQASARKGPRKFLPILVRALFDILGFTVVMFAVSFVRELFGNATLWGIPVPLPVRLTGMQIPFFGFVFTGFLLAFARIANRNLVGWRFRSAALRDQRYVEIVSSGEGVLLADLDALDRLDGADETEGDSHDNAETDSDDDGEPPEEGE